MRQYFPAAWEGKLRRWNARDWDCLALLFEPPCQGVPTIPGQSSHCELLSLNPFQGELRRIESQPFSRRIKLRPEPFLGQARLLSGGQGSDFRFNVKGFRESFCKILFFVRQIYSRSWTYYVKRIETTFFQMSEIWLFAFFPFPNLTKQIDEHESVSLNSVPNQQQEIFNLWR